MSRKRGVSVFGALVGVGFLTGCCLLSGSPMVEIIASSTLANVGEKVTFVAVASGGSGTYTYDWVGVVGQGPISSVVFQSPGEKLVGVRVTDTCGRTSQQARTAVAVTEDSLGDLTGLWEGEMTDPDTEPDAGGIRIRLLIFHRENTLQGTAYHGGRASVGSGSIIGNQVMFEFDFWHDTSRRVVLIGTLGAARNEIRGTHGGSDCPGCTWFVVKR